MPSTRLAFAFLAAAFLPISPVAAQEGEPPPEQPVTVVVSPSSQGVIGVGPSTKLVLVNLSRTKDGAVRLFWIYNAEIAPDGVSIPLRAGESRTIEAPMKDLGGRKIPPSTFLLYNNAAVGVAIHRLGD